MVINIITIIRDKRIYFFVISLFFLTKTECEKENPDFIEEITFREICMDVRNYLTGKTYNRCVDVNETTCREKTEVEKLEDKSCDELFKEYRDCASDKSCNIEQFITIIETWNEKECQI